VSFYQSGTPQVDIGNMRCTRPVKMSKQPYKINLYIFIFIANYYNNNKDNDKKQCKYV